MDKGKQLEEGRQHLSALKPLHVKRDVSDLSDFTSFVVPTRPLTAPERAVYRELATKWATLDGKAQATLHAMLLDGRLADFISDRFTKTASSIYAREEGIEHQKTRDLVPNFYKVLLEEHASHQLGLFYRTRETWQGAIETPPVPPIIVGGKEEAPGAAGEPPPSAPPEEQTAVGREAERERQPLELQAKPDEAQARRDRLRKLNTERARRYRQRRREREKEARRLAQEEARDKFMCEQYAQYEFSPDESKHIAEGLKRLADLFEQILGDPQSPKEDNS